MYTYTHTHTLLCLLSSSAVCFTILTILTHQTLSTRCHMAKTSTTSQPMRIAVQDPRVKAAGTNLTVSHEAKRLTPMTSGLKCTPSTAEAPVQIIDYRNKWIIVQTLNLLRHPVTALRVDWCTTGLAAQTGLDTTHPHNGFLHLMEHRGQMGTTAYQFQNTAERYDQQESKNIFLNVNVYVVWAHQSQVGALNKTPVQVAHYIFAIGFYALLTWLQCEPCRKTCFLYSSKGLHYACFFFLFLYFLHVL